MTGAPREESVVVAELAAVDGELAALEALATRHDRTRQHLEAGISAAETAMMDTRNPWTLPAWVKSSRSAWSDPSRFRDDCKGSLVYLGMIEAEGVGKLTTLSDALLDLDPLLADPTPARRNGRAADLRDRRNGLRAELKARRRGPGPKRVYRLLRGSHGRWEDGANRRYRAGATIVLDGWEAAQLGADRVELVKDTAAA